MTKENGNILTSGQVRWDLASGSVLIQAEVLGLRTAIEGTWVKKF